MKNIFIALILSNLFSGFASAFNNDKLVEFVDIFGQPLGQTYWERSAIRALPTPTFFSTKFYLREGLANSSCYSFESKIWPGEYLVTDKFVTTWPEELTIEPTSDPERATFCEQNGYLSSIKHNHRDYIIAIWKGSSEARKYNFDDRLVIAHIEEIPQDRHTDFIPVKYKETLDRQFTDSYSLSPVSGVALTQKAYLSEDNGKVIFRTHDFISESESNLEESSWFFHYVEEDYFVIQQKSNGQYLAEKADKVELVEFYETFSAVCKSTGNAFDYNKTKDNVLWQVKIANEKGEYLIFNKASKKILSVGHENGKNYTPTLSYFEPQHLTAGMLHNISERFTHLKLMPEDIVAQNSLIRLYNGLERRGLFVPHPFQGNHWGKRNQKITIEDQLSKKKYRFAQGVGSDPDLVTWSYDKESNSNIILDELIIRLPALRFNSYSEKLLVVHSVKAQLKNIYEATQNKKFRKGKGYTPSIIWLTSIENIPDQLAETLIDSTGKSLRVMSNKLDDEQVPAYGFLLIRTDEKGVETFTIDDPHPTTNDPRTSL